MRSSSRRQQQFVLAASAVLVVACSSDASGPRSQAGEIAFALHRGLYSDIVLAADTGGELRHLTVEAHAGAPAWSRDGALLAFADRFDPGDGSTPTRQIFVMRDDGSERRRVTHEATSGDYPSWSPDGRFIVYQCMDGRTDGTSSLCIVGLDGAGRRSLRRDISAGSPSWSPSGDRIAFTCPVPASAAARVCSVRPDGSELQALTPDSMQAAFPSWSPDGSRLAVSAFRHATGGSLSIYMVSNDGTFTGPVLPHDQPQVIRIGVTWAPDSRRVAFTRYSNGLPMIAIANVDGTGERPLVATPAEGRDPAWRPTVAH